MMPGNRTGSEINVYRLNNKCSGQSKHTEQQIYFLTERFCIGKWIQYNELLSAISGFGVKKGFVGVPDVIYRWCLLYAQG